VLFNISNGNRLANNVQEAYSFRKRFFGLMFKKDFPLGCALHLNPCRSVHTFFMNFPIDVIYLDDTYKVVGLNSNLTPSKLGNIVAEASSVIELPHGVIQSTRTEIGHYVMITKDK